MEAATGDKEFWIVDVVGNFCFVHPAKQGISFQLEPHHRQGKYLQFHTPRHLGLHPATALT